ncbi:hypothetical protein HNR23_001302 [Nocardiopsis mwathae]|uniref:Uncharacterized protein n=1 Tax=Nocardiopsis mwathae TaxID=1472723 RepID=A0A7X0D4F5_9ACTN|nr:hypothetical protein [Nocardiopsis mwathae]MBB6171242.1 hypothetical protein [Nocardiopsis mwathae]
MRTPIPTCRPAGEADPGGVRRIASLVSLVSLARLVAFELTRLARNPAPWLAVAYVSLRDLDRPELAHWGSILDIALVGSAITGAGMFVAALPAAVREVRYTGGTALPVARRARLTALLVAAAIGGAVLFLIPYAVLVWTSGPAPLAGSVTPAAFALPLLVSALGGTVGVLVGVWTRSWLMVPALILLVAANELLTVDVRVVDATAIPGVFQIGGVADALLQPGSYYSPGYWWLAPAHLVYLGLALAAAAALALLRHQSGGWGRALTAALAAVCLTGSAAAYTQRYEDGRRMNDYEMDVGSYAPWAGPVPDHTCRTRGGITYCAYAGYEQWIPYWHAAAAPVAAALPRRARGDVPRVVQQTFGRYPWNGEADALRDGLATPIDYWDPAEETPRLDLAEQIALPALGLRTYREYDCSIRGQARLPVYLWLVARGSHDTELLFNALYENRWTARDTEQAAVAVALLDAPEQRVARGLEAHWERLVSPGTGADEAARLLGIDVTDTHRRRAAEFVEAWRGDEPEDAPEEADFALVAPVPDSAAPPCR